MATLQEVIRRITIFGKTEGVDQATGSLRQLAGAQTGVAVATEKTSSATLSMEKRVESLQRSLDAEYRSQQNLARINKDLSAARAQGLITAQRQAELSALAAAKFDVEGAAALRMAGSLKVLRDVSVGLFSGLGAGLAIGGLAMLPGAIKAMIGEAADLQDVAETIGLTAANLQELEYAAGQAGMSSRDLDDVMVKFSKSMGDAERKGGDLAKVLKSNHVEVSGDTYTDLLAFADLVQKTGNAQERNSLVTAAFGKSGAEMGRLLGEGSEGIKKAADEAHRLNGVLSDDALKQAKEMDDAMAASSAQMGVAFRDIAITAGPAVVGTVQAITAAVQGIGAALHFVVDGVDDLIGRFLALEARSTGSIERELEVAKGLLSQSSPTVLRTLPNGRIENANPMAMQLGPEKTDDMQATVAALTAELERRKALEAALTRHSDSGGGGGGGGIEMLEKEAEAYASLIQAVDGRIAQLGAQKDALTATGVAADTMRNFTELLTQAEATKFALGETEIDQIYRKAEAEAKATEALAGAQMDHADADPFTKMIEGAQRLDELLADKAISGRTYFVEMAKNADEMASSYAGAAGNIIGNLESLTDAMGVQGKEAFEIHKGLAIARAVVSGGESIVHAYSSASVFGPVVAAAAAAPAAVSAIPQILKIKG